MGATVFVTGVAGQVGSHLAESLVSDGFRVRGLDNFQRGKPEWISNLPPSSFEMHQFEVSDSNAVLKLMDGCDFAVHLAAASVFSCNQNPDLAISTNIQGTFSVLQAAAATGVKRLVFASSVLVYDDAVADAITEDSKILPSTLYGASKAAGEFLAHSIHKKTGLKSTVLRYFNIYGPRSNLKNYVQVIPGWIMKAMKNENLIIHGDGRTELDLLYVEDAVRAILLALESKTDFAIYNIASGIPVSLNSLAHQIISLVNSNSKLEHVSAAEGKSVGGSHSRYADITLAKRDLGFTPRVALAEGLSKTYEWIKEALR